MDEDRGNRGQVWEVSPESEAVRPGPSLLRRLAPTRSAALMYMGLIILLALVVLMILPGGGGAGTITFGTGVDSSSRTLQNETSTFRVGDSFAFRATLTQSAPGNELSVRVTRSAAGATPTTTAYPVSGGGSTATQVLVLLEPRTLGPDDVGDWTMEILQGGKVLAKGSFTVDGGSGG